MYIYRGSFQTGYAGEVLFKNLVQTKRLIVVTFNYRLGAEGFLCLGTKNIPGNAGMKDQVSALKWIRKNIAYFGGNPDDITIDGSSAGAKSTDLFVLSKMTKGLFAKMITESGGSLQANSIQVDPIKNALQYASLVDFQADTIEQLEEFYLSASFDTLFAFDLGDRHNYLFKPCVERDIGQERFLDDSPYNIIKNGNYHKLPMLYGFTAQEGILRMETFDEWSVQMNANFASVLPIDLNFPSIREKEKVAHLAKQHYFGDEEVDTHSYTYILSYVTYFTDVLVYPFIRAARLYDETGNDKLYLYQYAFVDEESSQIKEPVPKNSSLVPWLPFTSDWSYMFLDDNFHMTSIYENSALFWDPIYERYYDNPIPPYDF
ncbi:unnamed protein product [Leptidea sinapis]|uniref:Carboxylic ester hydrolase n=1 Tax=Leptidea sinapis TaxID=189913 RepID=A0A5E4R856_9NEOP|nr:unnamed protein product [Leptidea sinapis]